MSAIADIRWEPITTGLWNMGPRFRGDDKRQAAPNSVSGLDDDVVVLDLDRHGFGDIGAGDQSRSGLDLHGVAAGANAGGIAPRLAGPDVEFPAVPGAADDLARAGVAIVAGPVRFHEPGLLALKQAAAAVRAAVVEGEELAAQIEHDDRAAIDLRELARAGRNVADCGDHVLGHAVSSSLSRPGRAPWRCRNRSCCGAPRSDSAAAPGMDRRSPSAGSRWRTESCPSRSTPSRRGRDRAPPTLPSAGSRPRNAHADIRTAPCANAGPRPSCASSSDRAASRATGSRRSPPRSARS